MRLYLRGNVWWARWTEAGRKMRRSAKTTHRDEAEATVASWGRKVDILNPLPPDGGRRQGTVYFIRAQGTDRIKIGFTQRPLEQRMAGLQNGCPYPLEVLATVQTWRLEELHLHRRFADLRVMRNSEWFFAKPALMHVIRMASEGRHLCPWCTGR